MDLDNLAYSEYCSLGPHSHIDESEVDQDEDEEVPEEVPEGQEAPRKQRPRQKSRPPPLVQPYVDEDGGEAGAPSSPRSRAVDLAAVMDFDLHQLAMDVNMAARFGDVEQLKHLIFRGADISVIDYDNRSPYVSFVFLNSQSYLPNWKYILMVGARTSIHTFFLAPFFSTFRRQTAHCCFRRQAECCRILAEPGH